MRLTNLGVIPSNKPWLSGYDYGKEIIIPANNIDEELINFPCTVYLDDTNFDFSKAKSDGSDKSYTAEEYEPYRLERITLREKYNLIESYTTQADLDAIKW